MRQPSQKHLLRQHLKRQYRQTYRRWPDRRLAAMAFDDMMKNRHRFSNQPFYKPWYRNYVNAIRYLLQRNS